MKVYIINYKYEGGEAQLYKVLSGSKQKAIEYLMRLMDRFGEIENFSFDAPDSWWFTSYDRIGLAMVTYYMFETELTKI